MTTLLALAFPYATTADAAAQDIRMQERDLATEPDAVAVVSRDDEGAFRVTTTHRLGEDERRFVWQVLLAALIFLPGSGGLPEEELRPFSQRLEAIGLDATFRDRVREMLAPGTSALFLLATEPIPAQALTSLGRFGGRLLAVSLVTDFDVRITEALHRTSWFAGTSRDETAQGGEYY